MPVGRQKKTKKSTLVVNTPYDDVFRTLLNDCSQLIIPVINEVFHDNYNGTEKIVFFQNEHFINQQDGREQERITDTHFQILESENTEGKDYHLECQSTTDSTLLLRMFEYAAQIALDHGEIEKDVLRVKFPNSAVLYLRSNSATPDMLHIQIEIGEDALQHDVPVMKVKNYSLDEIFQKKLLFLIPFYLFSHENRLPEYDQNEEKLEHLKQEYAEIVSRLEELCRTGELDEYTRKTIMEMSNKVLENLAQNCETVKKEVKKVMGGQILDYEAKRIRIAGLEEGLNRGRAEGRLEGHEEERREQIEKLLRKGKSPEEIADFCDYPLQLVQEVQEELFALR